MPFDDTIAKYSKIQTIVADDKSNYHEAMDKVLV